MNIAISGSRNLSPRDLPIIKQAMGAALLEFPGEIFFGGARGADTAALRATAEIRSGPGFPKLTVIVPWRLSDQPTEAINCASCYADLIIELKAASKLDIGAYARRNQELVKRADKLIAFWDGISHGTSMTIDMANEKGIFVQVVRLGGKQQSGSPAEATT